MRRFTTLIYSFSGPEPDNTMLPCNYSRICFVQDSDNKAVQRVIKKHKSTLFTLLNCNLLERFILILQIDKDFSLYGDLKSRGVYDAFKC